MADFDIINSNQLPQASESQIGSGEALIVSGGDVYRAPASRMKGADGKSAEIRRAGGYVQGRQSGGAWENLIAVAELKGSQGQPGTPGAPAPLPVFTFTATGGDAPKAIVSGVYPNLTVALTLPKGADAAPPNIGIATVGLAPGAEPTATVEGVYPNLTLKLGLPRGKDAEPPAFTVSAERVANAVEAAAELSGAYPNYQLKFKIPAGERGLQGKPLVVLPNGHYGNWDENTGKYVDSHVDASATVDVANAAVTFSEASDAAPLASGDTIPVLFGKVKKWLSRLGALAFKNRVDYATDIDNVPPPAAVVSKTSELTNDSGFVTQSDVSSTVANHDAANNAHPALVARIEELRNAALMRGKLKGVGAVSVYEESGETRISVSVDNQLFIPVSELPAAGVPNKIYLVPSGSPKTRNRLDEYVWNATAGEWEQVGSTAVSLTNYYTRSETDGKIESALNAYATTSSVQEAVNGTAIKEAAASLAATQWVQQGGAWVATVTVAGMSAQSTVWAAPDRASEDAWMTAGVYMRGESTAGGFKLYARNKPTGSITVAYSYRMK